MEATSMMKTLVLLIMLLAVIVHASNTDPPPSIIDSLPSDLLLPHFPPSEGDDPSSPPSVSCSNQCILKCAKSRGLGRLICMGGCLVMCRIMPSDGTTSYHCTRDCVMNSIHLLSNIKSVGGLVDGCYINCTKQV